MFPPQKSKKPVEMFLPFIFISFVCLLLLTHPEKVFSRCGDVDGDGNIFSNDVLMVARASINILTLTADQKLRTDVVVSSDQTPDGQILSNDLLIIARASLGMVTPLCNEGVVGSGKIEGYLADEGSSTKGGITVIVESVEPSTGLSRTAQAIIENVGARHALPSLNRLPLNKILQKITKTAVTDDTGHFTITDLPPGLYTACAIKVPDIQNPNCAEAADPKNHPEYAGKEVKIGLLPNIEIKNTTSQVVVGEKDDPNPQFKIAKTSSIRGIVKLKNTSNHLGILVFIPGTSFIAMTDVNGEYEISNVPIGQFILAASKAGYSEIMKPGISVEASQITVVPEFEIQPLTTCTISISNISASPMTLYPNDLTTITVTAQSSGCNTLSYSYTPTGGSVIGGGSSVQWQAPARAGLYSISVVVSDGSKFIYSFVPIFVEKIIIQPPVINSLTITPQEITTGETASLYANVMYAGDISKLTYFWSLSAGIISGTGSPVTYTAKNQDNSLLPQGVYPIYLIVSDNTNSVSAIGNIIVKNAAVQTIPEIASVQYIGKTVSAYDASNNKLWDYTVSSAVTSATLSDLNGDGNNEIIFGTDRDGSDKGVIYVLNKTGAKLWSYKTGSTGVYWPDEQLKVALIYTADVDGDGKKEIISVSNHYTSFPARICVISDTGVLQGSYWNPGNIYDVTLADIDSDGRQEIIAGGKNTDNGNKTIVFSLDGENVIGELEAPPDKGTAAGGSDKQKWYTTPPAVDYVAHVSVITENGMQKIKAETSGYIYYLDMNGNISNLPTNAPTSVSVTANPTSGTAPLTVYFNSACADTDGTCVSYSWNFGDGSATNTQQNPSHTFINAGTYTVILIAADDKGTPSAESRVTITVLSNHNPTISTTAVTTVTAGIAYSYDVNAADTDGDTLTYSLTTVPTGMTINSTTGLISWTPTTAGSYNVTVSVSDSNAGTTNQSFTITVANNNPVITTTAVTTVTASTGYSYDVNATDSDGDTLTYSLTCPTCLTNPTISSTTGLISWTPTTAGSYNVTVSVSDGKGGTANQSWTITVAVGNSNPVIASTAVTTVTASTGYSYDVNATDADGDTLTYALTTAPAGITISSTTGLISWTPTTAGSYNVTVSVSDSKGGTANQSWTITVAVGNSNPVITTTAVITITSNTAYSYDVNATDVNGDTLTYSLTCPTCPTNPTINSTTGVISWTPTTAGSYNVTVSVSDGKGGTANQSFTITVAVGNSNPVITTTAVTSVTANTAYSYDVNATDANGDTLTYSLTCPTCPINPTINSTTGLISWTPTTAGSYNVTVSVSDGRGGVANQSFTITVAIGNSNPVIASTAVTTVTAGTAYSYDVNATDVNGDTLTYTLTTKPSTMNINSTTGLISWTPTTAGSYSVSISVSDGKGGTANQSWTIIVSMVERAGGLVRDSAGNLYLAYHKGSPIQIYVAKSTDNGNTWIDIGGAPIQTISGYDQVYPSIAVDSLDDLHCVWRGIDNTNSVYAQIKYSKYSAGSWSIWTNIQTVTGYDQYAPTIAVDSLNNLHVVWSGRDYLNTVYMQIKYSKYNGTNWSNWTNIQTISAGHQGGPVIAIDSQNNLHVVWQGYGFYEVDYLAYQIKYSKYDGTSWSIGTNIQTISQHFQYSPSIAIDSSDNLHVVWYGTDNVSLGAYQIKYSKYNGTSWSTWTNIQTILGNDRDQYSPSIAIDSTGRLHTMWYGKDAGSTTYYQIKYSTCVSTCDNPANWSTWVNKTSNTSASQQYPTLRWSRWNNNAGTLDWAWTDGTTIKFSKDSTVTMSNWRGSGTPNNNPTITSTAVTTATTGTAYSYDVNATDVNGDTLTYSLTCPTCLTNPTINSTTGLISWTPTTAGSYIFTVSVSDGKGGTANQSFTITVSAANSNPTITSTAVTTATIGTAYSYDVNATDANGDTLTYSLTTSPSGMTINSTTGLISWTPTTAGSYNVTVSVSDGKGGTTNQSWTVTVSTPQVTTTVSTNVYSMSTSWNNARKLARDSAGNLYLAYSKNSLPPYEIYVAKSTDNGNSWIDIGNAPIQTISGYSQYRPSIAIDSSDNLHVVWLGLDSVNTIKAQIKYSKYNGTSWTTWTNIQTISGYGQNPPSIAVDSSNNLHVVWLGLDSVNTIKAQIKYSKYNDSSWGTWTNIQTISGYTQGNPSIAIDSLNNLHVMWNGNDSVNTTYQIKYSKYNSTSWSIWTNIQTILGNDRNQYSPSIAIDSSNNLHVIWDGTDSVNTTKAQIKYSKYNGSSWSVWTNIQTISGYTQVNSSIAVDSSGNLHVIWAGTNTGSATYSQIKYSRCTNNCQSSVNWTTWVNKTSSSNAAQQYPTLRWSRWNNNGSTLDWGWTDGTTVKFSKDPDVNMSQ